MSVKEGEKVPNYMTWEDYRGDVRYLREDMRNLQKKMRLLVRILVDKKIIGVELAKSIEETFGKDVVFDWFMAQIEEAKTEPKYKIQPMKGRFAVMVTTGKKFPPWKVVKLFTTKPEAQAHLNKLTKKSK